MTRLISLTAYILRLKTLLVILDFKPINFCDGWDHATYQHKQWVREKLSTTKYKYLDDGFKMIQFNSFLISRNVLDILNQNGISNILPTNKIQKGK